MQPAEKGESSEGGGQRAGQAVPSLVIPLHLCWEVGIQPVALGNPDSAVLPPLHTWAACRACPERVGGARDGASGQNESIDAGRASPASFQSFLRASYYCAGNCTDHSAGVSPPQGHSDLPVADAVDGPHVP